MTSRLRSFSILAVLALAACAEPPTQQQVAPLAALPGSLANVSAAPASEENGSVSSILGDLNAQLASSGAKVRIAKAELILDGKEWDGVSSSIIFANDRARGFGAEWVKGDPRRDGREGVNYAFGSNRSVFPRVVNPDGSFRLATLAELDARIEEGMAAWRDKQCSAKPITRVAIPAGTDPDFLDELINSLPVSGNYRQPADIVQAGWMPSQFFRNFAGVAGNNILGVTFTFIFVDGDSDGDGFDDVPTDIDGNGKADIGLSEIFYNARFIWTDAGRPGFVDFYSIITHESGHSLGLAHFGKIFVTKKATEDGVIFLSEVKFAPRAMMNAVYFTGRSELAGTDNSSFCQIWASK